MEPGSWEGLSMQVGQEVNRPGPTRNTPGILGVIEIRNSNLRPLVVYFRVRGNVQLPLQHEEIAPRSAASCYPFYPGYPAILRHHILAALGPSLRMDCCLEGLMAMEESHACSWTGKNLVKPGRSTSLL